MHMFSLVCPRSNLVSNVPAVMPLLKNIDPEQAKNLYLLALISTYAGNLFIIGSIANPITIEQAKLYNISVTFWSHASRHSSHGSLGNGGSCVLFYARMTL